MIGDVVVVKNSGDKTIAPGQRPQRLEHELGAVEGGLGGLTPPPDTGANPPRTADALVPSSGSGRGHRPFPPLLRTGRRTAGGG